MQPVNGSVNVLIAQQNAFRLTMRPALSTPAIEDLFPATRRHLVNASASNTLLRQACHQEIIRHRVRPCLNLTILPALAHRPAPVLHEFWNALKAL